MFLIYAYYGCIVGLVNFLLSSVNGYELFGRDEQVLNITLAAKISFHSLTIGTTSKADVDLVLRSSLPLGGAVVIGFPPQFSPGLNGITAIAIEPALVQELTVSVSPGGSVATVYGWEEEINANASVSFQFQDIVIPPTVATVSFPFIKTLADPAGGSSIDYAKDFSSLTLSGAGISFSVGVLAVVEGAYGERYSVVLTAEPSSTVNISATIDAQIKVLPSFLSFTPLNWNVPQSMLVTAVDDNIVENTTASIITHKIDTDDPSYSSDINWFPAINLSVSIFDNDNSFIYISTTVLNLDEGETFSYALNLLGEPTQDVMITIQPSDSNLTLLSSIPIIFNSENWNIPQLVYILAEDNSIASNNSIVTNLTHYASSSDALFNGAIFVPSSILSITIYDNDGDCYRECLPGYHSTLCSSDTLCVPCVAGFWCEGGCASPVPCPKGTASNKTSSDSQENCLSCLAGEYSITEGQSACLQCPAGYQCLISDVAPIECSSGTYSTSSSSKCIVCPDGYYASEPGQSSCSKCPSGYECSDKSAAPVPCASGSYAMEGATECIPCPEGYYCSSTGNSPQPCEQGTYSLPNGAYCVSCPPGYFCLNAAIDPQPCPAGSASLGSQSLCTMCEVGTYSNTTGSVTCTPCLAGHTCLDPTYAPVPCSPGFSCSSPKEAPVPCPYGMYALAGQSSCTPCPAGFHCTSDGNLIACDPGSFNGGLNAECTLCPAGYRCPTTTSNAPIVCLEGTYATAGQATCAICPAGYSCTLDGIITPCLPGTWSISSQSSCNRCSAGFYCPLTTSSNEIPCPAGSFSVSGAENCTLCPAGYQCMSSTLNQMELCPAGYASAVGKSSCDPCLAGFFSAVGASVCQSCPPGMYSSAAAATCTLCLAGTYSAGGTNACTDCLPGTYSIVGASVCTVCPPGYSCGSRATDPIKCTVGSYCPTGSDSAPILCPAGTFGTQEGSASLSDCEPCTEGYYCSGVGNNNQTRTICPSGSYCMVGISLPEPCPSGTYNSNEGQWSSMACISCPPGYSCGSGSIAGSPCAAGHYCPASTPTASSFPCPPGTYSAATSLYDSSQCIICPIGNYCTEGSATPSLCNAGTYNSNTGGMSQLACTLCEAGWACPTTGMTVMTTRCAAGSYCPTGTLSSTQYLCPPGTYSNSIDLIASSQCSPCPERFTCAAGTSTPTLVSCPAGYYCPVSSAIALPCAPGTWSDRPSLAKASECDVCPQGSYCSGAAAMPSPCAAGHYCPAGSTAASAMPCPAGFYSMSTDLFLAAQCLACSKGHYCPQASSKEIECPGGYYADVEEASICKECPSGNACVKGSITPIPCYIGCFSAARASQCARCPAGRYCSVTGTTEAAMLSGGYYWKNISDPSGACFNGTICLSEDGFGLDKAPNLLDDFCPMGYYCPSGIPTPVPCPAGTIQPLEGMDGPEDCQLTSFGYYSTEASITPMLCDPGYYCPPGSTGPKQIPCPPRYYRSDYGGGYETDCSLCVSGGYCPNGGNIEPVICPAGFYCITGVDTPEPCPLGTYSSTTGLRRIEDCVDCDAGSFCDQTGLTAPTGPCDPGYYCLRKSDTSAPTSPGSRNTSVDIGGVCPPGGYCTLGSTYPAACPQGTFNTFAGASSPDNCAPCTPGYYCEGTNNPSVSGPCLAGFYCIGGASTPVQYRAPIGTYTTEGSAEPILCPPGTYNIETGQAFCAEATPGYYAPDPGTTLLTICPPGTYCVGNSSFPELCSAGTYSNLVGRTKASDCTPASPGYFVDTNGMTTVTGPCHAGYYCASGSSMANPVGLAKIGDLCPPGFYCPLATGTPLACPIGTYLPSSGSSTIMDCIVCLAGYYCGEQGLAAVSGSCSAGYYCKFGVSIASPISGISNSTLVLGNFSSSGLVYGGDVCPIAHYCPTGTDTPILCPDGTYMNATTAALCNPCPGGFSCSGIGTTIPTICAEGFYCPEGTGTSMLLCPIGTYNSVTGIQSLNSCQICPAGSYCAFEGLTVPTGICTEGYYCPSGSQDSYGKTSSSIKSICPKGQYCPAGSAEGIPCPIGTYMPNTGATALNNCVVCSDGYYCESPGLEKPNGPCKGGYYCRRGVNTAAPTVGIYTTTYISGDYTSSGLTYGGDICPGGSYCLEGAVSPQMCNAGSYSAPGESSAACRVCNPGFTCPIGTAA